MKVVVRLASAAAALCLSAGMAAAQATSDRELLFKYYIVHVAVDACEIDVPKRVADKFDKMTDQLETKVGASKAEMDGTFKTIKAGAQQNPKGFCDTYKKVAIETLNEVE